MEIFDIDQDNETRQINTMGDYNEMPKSNNANIKIWESDQILAISNAALNLFDTFYPNIDDTVALPWVFVEIGQYRILVYHDILVIVRSYYTEFGHEMISHETVGARLCLSHRFVLLGNGV